MTSAKWDELYLKLTEAYEFAGEVNEHVRTGIGELLDYMDEYDARWKPIHD
jgi:hypothetical protein